MLLVGAAPVRDEARRIVAGVAVFQNITELKRAQAEVTFRAQALDQTADAVVVVDNDLRATYLNRAARDLTGVGPAEVLDWDLSDLWCHGWADRESEHVAYDRLREDGVWRGETLSVTCDGRRIPMDIYGHSAPGRWGEGAWLPGRHARHL